MHNRKTARSVRANRNSSLKYKSLESRQLLAADLAMANAQLVCDRPDKLADTVDVKNTELARNTMVDVTEVIVGDGTDSRSIVESITVVFDGIVAPEAEAFSITNRDSGDLVAIDWTIDNSEGFSKVEIRFSGAQTTNSSLVDGNYELFVDGDLLGDSNSGTDFVFGNMEDDDFYRFFGDSGGDRSVDIRELLEFRRTWLETASEDRFDDRFDHNGDETVNSVDLLEFRRNFRESLGWIQ